MVSLVSVSLVSANLEAHPNFLTPHPPPLSNFYHHHHYYLDECKCRAWQPLKLPPTPLLERPGYYQRTATFDWPIPAPGRCHHLDRPDGPFTIVAPTASHARNEPSNLSPTALDAPAITHIPSPSQQPDYPAPGSSQPQAQRAQQAPGPERTLLTARSRALRGPNDYLPPPPFRNRATGSNPNSYSNSNPQYSLPRRIGTVGRLWNPTNSTPRPLPVQSTRQPRQPRQPRRRRPSTPPPPPVPVPVAHPTIDISEPTDPTGTGAGDYPLLRLPDQRQGRHSPHSASTRASLQIEGRASGDRRISLPSSVRHSYDAKRTSNPPLEEEAEAGPSKVKLKENPPSTSAGRKRGQSVVQRARALSFGLVNLDNSPKRSEKGKGKAVMSPSTQDDPSTGFSKDLERGDVLASGHNASNLSLPGGGPSIISSSNSSIMGDPDQPDMGEEWGPQHPCFPHMNPHVPMSSPEYKTTRIIRVRRDWLIEGDVAPTFSNLYPEILDPAGVSEQEFRRIIEKLNSELIPIFDPYYWRNILDGILGLLTGWIWDDLGFSNAKSRLRNLENWIDQWNAEKEKTVGAEDGSLAPRIVSLRRTGYMNLDIQIPDPEVRVAASELGSRSGPSLPLEPEPVALNDAPDGS
ncbi:Golgin subfamily A member 7/ERF4 family-domain-containing protein [Biscogniauxia mediterranea]|nr:Golgin subfamily A member 7/ERF4 family-domain-containing protein [Biscogniauxia mediterranea]